MALRAPVPGLVLTLVSAVSLSTLSVLTQLSLEEGTTVGTALLGRFLVAALVLWLLVWTIRRRRPSRRQLAAGLLLGVGYSAHAWLFGSALTRLDAGLVDLLVFTYPALVMLGAVALRRERWSLRRAVALGAATAGSALVLLGGLHSVDPLGAALALAAAVAYAGYILVSAGELERTDPFLLTALVTTGAAFTLGVVGIARSDLSLQTSVSGLALIPVLGLVAVAGMTSFVAGIARLGPSRASIVSAVQPALTPVLGLAVFADRLGPAQVLGGGLVVAGVVVLEAGSGPFSSRTWLSWLPRRERRLLRRTAPAIELPAGRRVVTEGSAAGAFFLIERGRAAVSRDGRRVAELAPGDFFGEVALLNGGTRTASVVAETDLRVRVLPRREFDRAMRALPTLARIVREATVARLRPAAPFQPALAA